jgi:uncharacterized membrane protein
LRGEADAAHHSAVTSYARARDPNGSVLILAKSNAAVAAISRAARERSQAPPRFIARILSGWLVGATVGAAAGSLIGGLLAGTVGAVVGTLGGAATRRRLAKASGKDLPAALLEDVAAVLISIVAVSKF